MSKPPSAKAPLRWLGAVTALLALGTGTAPALAWEPFTTAQNIEILRIVHAVTDAYLGEPTQFSVRTARTLDGWAFVDVTPQKDEGVRFYYEVTRYAEALEFGRFEERVLALLRESELGWVLFEFNLGDGVEVIDQWLDDYDVPAALFE